MQKYVYYTIGTKRTQNFSLPFFYSYFQFDLISFFLKRKKNQHKKEMYFNYYKS